MGPVLLLLIWLHPEDPDDLVTALARQLRTESCMFGEITRFIGAYGLAELGPAARSAVPALREALTEREPVVRALAAYALAVASPVDWPAAIRTLRQIAAEKPGPGTREFQFGIESTQKIRQVEIDASGAVVDVLLTQEPGNHFPTDFLLTWLQLGHRQYGGDVAKWFQATPLSTNLADAMVRRLEP